MEAVSTSERDNSMDAPTDYDTGIKACESRPGRLVFLENGNTDGWIATDLAVDLPL